MDVIVSKDQMDVQECDVLVLGFFNDLRPLKGSMGWIDWRFNGRLSRFFIHKQLTGEWNEMTLIPSQGRIKPRMILLLGLGRRREYDSLRIREIPSCFLKTLKKLDVHNICPSLPHGEDFGIDCKNLVEILLEGIGDCLNLDEFQSDRDWINHLRLFFAEGRKHFSEMVTGVQVAQSMMKGKIQINLLKTSDDDPHEARPRSFF